MPKNAKNGLKAVLSKKRFQQLIESILKMAKNGHNAKAKALAKYSVWVKKLNMLKNAKNGSTSTLKLFYGKNGSKKQLIFEKRAF